MCVWQRAGKWSELILLSLFKAALRVSLFNDAKQLGVSSAGAAGIIHTDNT